MDTYWLVAILICLLLVDFLYRLYKEGPRQPRTSWTIPTSLLILTILTATFCLGLTWRYYVGSQQPDIRFLDSWLPAVISVMAVAILFGIIESWHSIDPPTESKPDLYDLLETSYPVEDEPLRVNRKQISQLAKQGSILAISLVIGWSVTSYLVATPEMPSLSALFPDARVRPASTSSRPAANVLIADAVESPVSFNENEQEHTNQTTDPAESAESTPAQNTNNRRLTNGAMVGTNSLAGLEPNGIGGPLREVSLDGLAEKPLTLFASDSAQTEADIQRSPPNEAYYVVVQTILGVKARISPSTAADVITTLAYQEELMALARTPDSAWIQIQWLDSSTAWIFADAIGATLRTHEGDLVLIDVLPIMAITP